MSMPLNKKLYRILNPEVTRTPHKLRTSRKRAKRLAAQNRAVIDTERRTVKFLAVEQGAKR